MFGCDCQLMIIYQEIRDRIMTSVGRKTWGPDILFMGVFSLIEKTF